MYISTRDGCSIDEALRRFERAEAAGFHTAWLGQIDDYDALGVLALAGRVTRKIELGTWVIPSHPRHPFALAQQVATVQAASRNRLVLGLGVGHRAVVEKRLGLSFTAPVRHLAAYLDVLDPLLRGEQPHGTSSGYRAELRLRVAGTTRPQILLAALGPRMLELAGRRADGVAIWLGNTQYLRDFALPRVQSAARNAGRELPRVVCGLPIAVTRLTDAARRAAGEFLGRSSRLPSYRAVLERGGARAPEDVALIGGPDDIEKALRSLAEIGVTDVNAVLFPVPEDAEAMQRTYRFLAELAPRAARTFS